MNAYETGLTDSAPPSNDKLFDTFTLTTTYAIEVFTNGRTNQATVSTDLETAWESCKEVSRLPNVKEVVLFRIGEHSNYGHPLTGTTTTLFANGHAQTTATRYSNPA
jgi:hypothetical protein